MALVTVADLLHDVLAAPGGAYELLGGKAGLAREVTWTMSARPSSPIFPTLRPGEIALASAPRLRQLDPPAHLPPLIEWLAERGAAGLLLRGPLDAAERAAAAVADRAGLPLLVIDEHTSLAELERAITTLVRERRDEFYTRTAHLQEVQFQLTESPGTGRAAGLDPVVQAVADLVHAPVALTSPPPACELRSLAVGPPGERGSGPSLAALWPALVGQALAAWQAPTALRNARPAEPPVLALAAQSGAVVLAAPILVRERVAGALLMGAPGPAAEIDRLTLARAAGICALEMARRQAVVVAETRTEQRLRGDFIADLLQPGGSEEVLLARARALGIEIAPAYAVALLAPALPAESAEATLEAAVAALAQGARESGAVFQVLGGRLAVLWPLVPHAPARRDDGAPPPPLEEPEGLVWLAQELRRQVQRRGDARVAGGVGRLYPGLRGAARSRHEAEQALWAARQLFGGDEVCRYSDLGIYRLLLPLRDGHADELRTFYEETLGALGGAAGPHAKLLDTLDGYLTHGGNISETAKALRLHRNTLSYRLHRISEVAGLDLDDPGVRFRAQVALCVRRLLQS